MKKHTSNKLLLFSTRKLSNHIIMLYKNTTVYISLNFSNLISQDTEVFQNTKSTEKFLRYIILCVENQQWGR